jgi:hypothetical protein
MVKGLLAWSHNNQVLEVKHMLVEVDIEAAGRQMVCYKQQRMCTAVQMLQQSCSGGAAQQPILRRAGQLPAAALVL